MGVARLVLRQMFHHGFVILNCPDSWEPWIEKPLVGGEDPL